MPCAICGKPTEAQTVPEQWRYSVETYGHIFCQKHRKESEEVIGEWSIQQRKKLRGLE